jgi:hypothetical protein
MTAATPEPPVCDCCGRKVIKTRWLSIVSDNKTMLCDDCLDEWYDGGHDGNTEKIKAGVLEKYGQYGGSANLTEILLKKVYA